MKRLFLHFMLPIMLFITMQTTVCAEEIRDNVQNIAEEAALGPYTENDTVYAGDAKDITLYSSFRTTIDTVESEDPSTAVGKITGTSIVTTSSGTKYGKTIRVEGLKAGSTRLIIRDYGGTITGILNITVTTASLEINEHVNYEKTIKINSLGPETYTTDSADVICEKTGSGTSTSSITVGGNTTSVTTYVSTLKLKFVKAGVFNCNLIGSSSGVVYNINARISDHIWSDKYTIDVEPTCLNKGKGSIHCTKCSAVSVTVDLPKIGHTEVIDPAVPATCIQTGKTEGTHCSVCNTVIKRQEIEPIKEHTWSDWKIIQEATANSTGLRKRGCSVCRKEESDVMPKLPVNEDEKIYMGEIQLWVSQVEEIEENNIGEDVVWTSSNNKIAAVNNLGEVIGKKKGTCIVKGISESGLVLFYDVVVKQAVNSISILNPVTQLVVGETYSLVTSVMPNNANSKKLTWKSSNNAVATVSTKGAVKAICAGKTTITATAKDGSGIKTQMVLQVKTDTTEDDVSMEKATYTIKKYRAEETYGRVVGKFEYHLPQLSGSSSAVAKINKDLKKEYNKVAPSMKKILDFAKDYGASVGYGETITVFSTATCKTTYNKKGIVSFSYTVRYYAGGVLNQYHHGLSYDLKTGKRLKLTDVIKDASTTTAVKNAVINAYCSKLGDSVRYSSYLNSTLNKGLSALHFYLQNGKVLVSIGAYGPMGGNGEVIVKLAGRYS